MAGAAFGELGVSLFVAGAVFGEIWVDSRSAKCCNFQSCSNRPRIGIDASTVLGEFLLDFGMQFCMAGAVFGEVGG